MSSSDRYGRGGSTDEVLLFSKSAGNDEDEDSDWDDSALVKAYDDAVRRARTVAFNTSADPEQSAESYESADQSTKAQSSQSKSQKKQSGTRCKRSGGREVNWNVGDKCEAVWTEDSCVYSATITEINGDSCIVEFANYGNKQKMKLADLLPAAAAAGGGGGGGADFGLDDFDFNAYSDYAYRDPCCDPCSDPCRNPCDNYYDPGNCPLPRNLSRPPPTPCLPAEVCRIMDDNTYKLVMSWYMCGYYTGYFAGKRCGCRNCKN